MIDPAPDPTRRIRAAPRAWRERIATLDRATSSFRTAASCWASAARSSCGWRSSGAISPAWPVGVWLAFGALAVVHARLLQRNERARGAERVYLRGFDRLSGEWAGTGRDGAMFLEGHPYARDLDLFGRASLFELLNTARTEIGEETLADWLRGPARAARGARPAGGGRRAAAEARFPRGPRGARGRTPVGRTGRWRHGPRRRRRASGRALRIVLAAFAAVTIAPRGRGLLRDRRIGVAVHLGDRGDRACVDLAPAGSTTSCTRSRRPRTISPCWPACSRASSASASRRRGWRRFSSGW